MSLFTQGGVIFSFAISEKHSISEMENEMEGYENMETDYPAILIPACASSSPVFLMMYSAYKLDKQVTIYSLDILLSRFGTSLLFHVQF